MIRTKSASRPVSLTQHINLVKIQQLASTSSVSFFEPNKSSQRIMPPLVTAAAWSIHDVNSGELLWDKKATEQREMASLTKIMTCYLSYQLLCRFKENPEKLCFVVNRPSAIIFGTHAGLKENDTVKVIDLLYGLMLPSGNDCALTLAYGFGNMLLKAKRNRVADRLPRSPVQEFVKEMNKLTSKLGLKATCFTNPHGLSEKGNKSTVTDLGKLAFHAIQIPLISKIVSTQVYNTEILNAQGLKRPMCWRNTNKLLERGFVGLKTGTTPSAGLCLSSVLKQGDDGVIVTLLNAKSDAHRWNESEKLAHWALNTILSVKDKMDCLSDITRAKMTPKLIAEISKNL